MKKLFTLIMSCLLLFTAVACQTVTPSVRPTSADPTAEPTEKPIGNVGERTVVKEAVPASVSYTTESDGGITYTVAKFTEGTDAVYNYGGTNIALGKPVTSSGDYPGYFPAALTDGNPSNLWASEAVDNCWVQIDLGEPMTIGRVELRSRPDGDQAGERNHFEIQLSNDESFATYEVMYAHGYQPYPYLTWFVINNPLSGQYRYVRMQRIDAGHFTLSEFRVFDVAADFPEEAPAENAPVGSQMVISRSGKALSLCGNAAVADSYNFVNTQRWYVETEADGFRLKSAADGKYLTVVDNKLVLADTGSLFTSTSAESVWSRLSVDGKPVVSRNGELALADQSDSKDDFEYWTILTAYTNDLPKGDVSWQKNTYGIMYHLLPDASTVRSIANLFDCDKVAAQVKDAGASYFLLSIGQNSGYYNTPNSVFSSIVSKYSDKRFAREDILTKMADALEKHGLKLMVYSTTLPGEASSLGDWNDFGLVNGRHTDESAMLWSLCLREWAMTYGDKAVGWWMDGGYCGTSTQKQLLILANGIKCGNPNAAISFNAGIEVSENSIYDEFTCGETDYPFGSDTVLDDRSTWLTPNNHPIANQAWFELTFLNKGWCFNPGPRAGLYDKALWAEYVKTVLDQGGGICLDVTYEWASFRMLDSMTDILSAIKEAVYTK